VHFFIISNEKFYLKVHFKSLFNNRLSHYTFVDVLTYKLLNFYNFPLSLGAKIIPESSLNTIEMSESDI